MSFEAIKIISDAEADALRALDAANEAAERAVAEAEEAGRMLVEGAIARARAELDEMKRVALDKARQGAQDLARNTENRKAAMLVKAQARKDKAIDFVIESVVRSS